MVEIVVNVSEIPQLAEKYETVKDNFLNNVAASLLREVKIKSPVKEGFLQNSWYESNRDSDSVTISSGVEYADYVNSGTKPHDIFPVNKQSLFWEGLGHPLPKGRGVHHPGITPRHFVEDSIEIVESQIEDLWIRSGG